MSKLYTFVFFGLLDCPRGQPRTAQVTFHHLVSARGLQRCRSIPSHRQLRTHHVSSCALFPLFVHRPSSIHAINSPCSFKLCVMITFIGHWTCKVQFPDFERTIREHLTFDGIQHLPPQVTQHTRTLRLTCRSRGRVWDTVSIVRPM